MLEIIVLFHLNGTVDTRFIRANYIDNTQVLTAAIKEKQQKKHSFKVGVLFQSRCSFSKEAQNRRLSSLLVLEHDFSKEPKI